MSGAIILLIFRSNRLCVTACGIMHPRCCRPLPDGNIVGAQAVTHFSAPEDGKNNCPKQVEMTGIINKSLLLHIFGCLYYLYQDVANRQEREMDPSDAGTVTARSSAPLCLQEPV